MECEVLNEITCAFFDELEEKYPRLYFEKFELQAPGYAIGCRMHGKSHLFMLKMTNGGVLFDTENLPEIPGYSDRMAMGMHRRLLTIEYENPRMVEIVFALVEKFLHDAGVVDC